LKIQKEWNAYGPKEKIISYMSVGRDISRRLNVGFFYWASDQYKWVWFSPFFFFFFYLFLNQDLNNINQEKMKKIKK
jgi:hypothetical protein